MKINHYARPIDSDYSLPWESLLIEGAICIICSVMAIAGYKSGVVLMFAPAGFVAVICGLLVIYTLISSLRCRMALRAASKRGGTDDNE
ncbi:hypothetical protein [Alteromonas antoniana]|uniref:hypothetical protein n=1 Tax=Alteromonas antoniana TaxID=2803813 RepID=UPI001FE5442A|nr:hypothetical protein [Alteromonas antoniana]